MSTIEEVRQAEIAEIRLDAPKNSSAHYADELALELEESSDEYARVVRELK